MHLILLLLAIFINVSPTSTMVRLNCNQNITFAKRSLHPLVEFGANLHRKLISPRIIFNLVFSPASIGIALSLLQVQSEGETKTELEEILSPDGNLSDVGSIYQSLAKYLPTNENSDTKLKITNGVFCSNESTTYSPDLVECYGARIQEMDFSNCEVAAGSINKWVSREVEGRISPLLTRHEITATTKAVLVNLVHFEAPWAERMRPVEEMKFYQFGSEDRTTKVQFIGRIGSFRYVEDTDFRLVKIPFKDNLFNFQILLPKKRDGFHVVQQQLNTQKFKNLAPNFAFKTLDLKFPRFVIQTNMVLKGILINMGLRNVFLNEANSSGINDFTRSLKVDEIAHRSHIKVTEFGVGDINSTLDDPPPTPQRPTETPIPFIADHPFFFAVFHQELGSPIYFGNVNHIDY